MGIAGISVSLAASQLGDFWFLSIPLRYVSAVTRMVEMQCFTVQRREHWCLDTGRTRVSLTSRGLLVSTCAKWG